MTWSHADRRERRELHDALTLLKQIAADCDGAPHGHGWRTCKRCLALHGIEQRFDLSMRLIQAAIAGLEREAISYDARTLAKLRRRPSKTMR